MSYVLNRRSTEVSEATRQRVLEAVAELDYRPNALARALAGQPTRSLGLVWTEGEGGAVEGGLGEGGLSAFLAGLSEAIYESGYTLTLAGGVAPGELAPRLRELLSRQVEGLLLLAAAFPGDERLQEELVRRGRPLVVCGPVPEGFPAARVDVDHREGMRLAAAHLLALGHRHLAYLDVPGEWPYGPRREGFRAAVEAMDPRPETMTIPRGGTEADGYQAGERLLAQTERPSAVVCANDALAVGLLRAAWRHGVTVPEELAVVGFGDFPAGAYTVPTLTTVRASLRAMGAAAGETLMEAVEAGKPAQGCRLIPPKLVVRESCGSHLWL
ncbi:MAG TPA: LacI family transcriptional regulator [Firmicutes bacterium]|nr:LacI family transcriptional regulator [Bacillota bacterium]